MKRPRPRARQDDPTREPFAQPAIRHDLNQTMEETIAHIEMKLGMPLHEIGSGMRSLRDLHPELAVMASWFKERTEFYKGMRGDLIRMTVQGAYGLVLTALGVGVLVMLARALGAIP